MKDPDGVRVRELAQRARLAPEARHEVLAVRQLGVKDLHAHHPAVLDLHRLVDGAHPAGADLLQDTEASVQNVASDERVLRAHAARSSGITTRLGGIIAGVPLLRSKALEAAGLLHAFPERDATDAELARELRSAPGLGDRPGEAGARRRRDRGDRRGRGERGRRCRRASSAGRARARRGRGARGRLRARSGRRRGERRRGGDPRGVARGGRRGRAVRGRALGGRLRAAARASSRRSGRASGRAASRSGATWPRSRGPRTARAWSRPCAATRRTSTSGPRCGRSSSRPASATRASRTCPGARSTRPQVPLVPSRRRQQRPHARGDRDQTRRRERMPPHDEGRPQRHQQGRRQHADRAAEPGHGRAPGRDLRQVRVPEPGGQPQGPPRARTCSAGPRRTASSRAGRLWRPRAETRARRSRCWRRCAGTSASS